MLITCLYSFNRFEIISTKKRIIIRKKTYTKCSGTKGRSLPRPKARPPFCLQPSPLPVTAPQSRNSFPVSPGSLALQSLHFLVSREGPDGWPA